LQPDNTSRATQQIAGRHDLFRDTALHFTVRDTSRQLSTQCENHWSIDYEKEWWQAGPALADAGPNARPRHVAPLSSDFMTSSCSVNRVTIVAERRYAVQH